jgi:hypothetical protein
LSRADVRGRYSGLGREEDAVKGVRPNRVFDKYVVDIQHLNIFSGSHEPRFRMVMPPVGEVC